jgi:hypothetical protein
MKLLARLVAALAGVYVLLVGGLAVAMMQPPDTFGQVMAKMPRAAFIVLPFKPLWMATRAGRLDVGDQAPDFTLSTVDHAADVRLSSHRGQRPVVLVFGSYT